MARAEHSRELAASYMIIGSPYPIDIPINGGIVVTGATKGNSINTGDNLQIMDADGNYDIYYMSNGKGAKTSSPVDPDLDGKWSLYGKYEPTDAKFPAGGAAWYIRKGDATVSVKFVKPDVTE